MAKDLKAVSSNNKLNMLMTYWFSVTDSDVSLEDKFENVKQWAKDNQVILNISKICYNYCFYPMF